VAAQVTEALAEDTRLAAPEGVILGELPGETVLLSIATGIALRLNATGAWLWSQLDHEPSLGELATGLAERHDIERDRALADVRAFAEDLASRDFLDLH
jgi:hypothetical protein